MKNIHKSVIFASFLSIISTGTVFFVQLHGETSVSKCSYLDPVSIDVLAFLAASFLVIEGFYSILKNKEKPLKNQIARSIRIAFGFSILTIHTLQVLHKFSIL